MNRKEILSVSLIAIIFAFSFYAATYSQGNLVSSPGITRGEDTRPLILSVPIVIGMDFHESLTSLNQSTRMEIYDFVKKNPGIHFRGICSNLGLPVGVVQYHLGLLTSASLLSVHRDGRYKRYFCSKKFGENEMKMISLLRHETAGKILSILLEKQSISHKDLASKLGVSSQALTWQINRLMKMGLIDFVTEGMKVKYLLDEENASMVKLCLGFII